MWILTFENSKNAHFFKIRRPFSEVKVYMHCEFLLSKIQKMPIFFKIRRPYRKVKVYRHCEFWLSKIKKMRIFLKIRRPFSKVKVYRNCEFWLLKIQKMRIFFFKFTAHFQKLKFTCIVNFDFRKFKNVHFLKNSPPIFKI